MACAFVRQDELWKRRLGTGLVRELRLGCLRNLLIVAAAHLIVLGPTRKYFAMISARRAIPRK